MSVFHRHVTKSLNAFRLCFLMGTLLAYAEKSVMIALSRLFDEKDAVVNSGLTGFQIKLYFVR